jgi:crotonobetainyl-CoA:carnitine CoA-transferase CaiB-like acyl-CoA transferase
LEIEIMTAQTPQTALAGILDTVGFDAIPGDHVAFTGADPVLPSNFLIGTAGASSIAASGLAAADLWELRSGRRQDVGVDVRAAAMAMRGSRYTRKVGGTSSGGMADISDFYQCGDGRWVQLHCNFPHHRDGTLKILGCEGTKEAVAAALRDWEATKLEETLVAADLCCTMTRGNAEWEASEHAATVANMPLMEITRIGDSDPQPLPDGDRPLAGIRALDLTRVLAGPTCGRTLAEHGADVMRISGPHLPFHPALVMDTGHGKLAAHVDLRDEAGTETLRELVRGADIFTQGYRPGTLARRGFAPEHLAALRPGIVCVSLCAYGREGPWRNRRGYDTLVQNATGICDEQGGEGPPRHLPVSLLDYASGYLMAFGAMAALGRRARDGGSYHVQVSLCQTAHWLKGLGRVAASANARDLPDPKAEDVADLLMQSDTPFGRLEHLAPTVQLSETPPHWARPVVPLGTHDPVWPG